MKISRFKKSHKTLVFFASNFDYREPYQVLVDATFCQAALQHKIGIEEQIRKYFQCNVKLLTTQCVILEAEALGAPLTGATTIVKQFHVHKCGHEGKPVAAAECIKSMTKDNRYVVASQDRLLQASLRKIPGRCLLYLHKATPVLEAPSAASKKWVLKRAKNLMLGKQADKIDYMKQQQGIKPTEPAVKKKQQRGPKNPNPLSCKKSKKQKAAPQGVQQTTTTIAKAKRKRVKISAHIKELIN
ncbi:rRNA-processing protein UTP23 homolog [Drosophila nasuta]|uniref:rRNA-processing protein UTP23 homolog n=1 Tax=Drosophila albomicans TaxID=7291 RepID=A0A6P8WKB1_DROAB|nr:rRNA-processing protein UTP23 homolog [Drosophila albomicans]XP_060666980.1 rRNA-processing protein UTP23 homolog [Drosophila nasuta]